MHHLCNSQNSALISSTKSHPVLWDLYCTDNKNVEKCKQHWHIIGQSYGMTSKICWHKLETETLDKLEIALLHSTTNCLWCVLSKQIILGTVACFLVSSWWNQFLLEACETSEHNTRERPREGCSGSVGDTGLNTEENQFLHSLNFL